MNWDCPQIDDEGEFGRSRLRHLVQTPEQDLVVNILFQAIRDATTAPRFVTRDELSVRANDRNRRRALNWIYSHNTHEFSFEWCCSVVSLDAEAVRERVRRDPGHLHERVLEQHLHRRERGGRRPRGQTIGEEVVRA